MDRLEPDPRASWLVTGFFRLDESTFVGYVVRTDEPSRRFVVEVLIDGEPVAVVRAERFERSLRDEGYGDGCYGFTYTARRERLTGHRRIEARLANEGTVLGHPIDLARDPYDTRQAALQRGAVEWAGGVRLIGTALERGAGAGEPLIRVYERDQLIAEGRPRRWLPVGKAGQEPGALGFDLALPLDLADGQVHQLRVEDETGQELDGSPLAILAFDDGLKRHLERGAALPGETPRAEWFERLFPSSIPFAAYDEWRRRFPRAKPPAQPRPAVRVVLIGEADIEAAVHRLSGQTHGGWTAASIPADSTGLNFSWSDLREALHADRSNEEIAVFASTGTVLAPDALALLSDTLADDPEALVAYGDIEVTGADGKVQPVFFGAFDYERLIEQGYAAHLFAVRLQEVVIPEEEASASLVRLFLALLDRDGPAFGRRVVHRPGVLATISSEAASSEAAGAAGAVLQQATAAHLRARRVSADVSAAERGLFPAIRVRRMREREPIVSIIIPTRDRIDLLSACIASIRSQTRGVDYEIVVVDNESASAEAAVFFAELAQDGATVVSVPGPFNYSRLNTRGVEAARGELLCFLNNDTEAIDADWLAELASRLVEHDVGAVSPLLLYPNRVVQHGGVVLGPNFAASDAFNDCMAGDAGYGDLLRVAHESSALTAACLLVRREDYVKIGGFDEIAFPVLFNDVDFCLRLRSVGRRNIVTPHVALVHHESASRGPDSSPDRAGRFRRDLNALRQRWGDVLAADPLYSPFLNLDPYPFSALAWPPRHDAPRRNIVSRPARP